MEQVLLKLKELQKFLEIIHFLQQVNFEVLFFFYIEKINRNFSGEESRYIWDTPEYEIPPIVCGYYFILFLDI
jgi:hypothetical protein